MAPRISLILVLHNHQPVGNFGWVIADACETAYAPMVAALERHSSVRMGLHYSGPLLAWLRAERPELVERLTILARRGQVELLGGGWSEPILVSLPERDRVGQLVRMADEVEQTFGARPAGAWLAERVWEPDVPTSLVDAGYAWTILDDAHFRAASIADAAMWGPYATEDQGRSLAVFGTEQGLRYRIPFRDVEETIAHLQQHATEAGDRVGTMGDDGEKFGAWPTTSAHCWGKGRWVERFLEALEANADWLTTTTPSRWLADHPPIGRVYIPVGSYAEMGEWALPPDEAVAFAAAARAARDAGDPVGRWLHGASWRNFQVRYREVNDLHKQMLRVSDRVAAMPDGAPRDSAVEHLYRGQSNDPYWHGLFGGVYLPDLRVAVARGLIAAEDLADAVDGAVASGLIADLDLDGRPEVLLATAGQVVTVKPDDGGGIGRWDIRAARHPLASVLRRRPEAYHTILREHEASAGGHPKTEAGAASIHELVVAKETGLVDRIRYDGHERRSGLVLLLHDGDATPGSWAAGELTPPDWGSQAHDIETVGPTGVALVWAGSSQARIRVRSTFEVGGGRLDPSLVQTVTLDNTAPGPLSARLGLEWSLMLLGGGGNPAAWWDIDDVRTTHDATREATGIGRWRSGNDQIGITVEATAEPAADVWIAPIETVSNSEGGFERVYQGSGMLVSWLVDRMAPGSSVAVRLVHRVSVAVDRAVEEGLPIPR